MISETLQQTLDFSTFSNYGSNIDNEIQAEIALSLFTDRYSIPYNRNFGTELNRRIWQPYTLSASIKMLVECIESIQRYNDESPTGKERRVSVSQDSFEVDDTAQSKGQIFVFVNYIRLKDLQQSNLSVARTR